MKMITIEQMADFAHTKTGPYNFFDPCDCAMAQYAREELGFRNPSVAAACNWATSWGIRDRGSDEPCEYKVTYDRRLEPHLAAVCTWEDLANSLDQMLDEPFADIDYEDA